MFVEICSKLPVMNIPGSIPRNKSTFLQMIFSRPLG